MTERSLYAHAADPAPDRLPAPGRPGRSAGARLRRLHRRYDQSRAGASAAGRRWAGSPSWSASRMPRSEPLGAAHGGHPPPRRTRRAAGLPPPAPSDPWNRLIASKLRLTELRGALGPDVTIAMDVSRGSCLSTVRGPRRLRRRPRRRGPGPALRPPHGAGSCCRRLDVAAALEATRRGGADVWVMQAPDDVLEAQNSSGGDRPGPRPHRRRVTPRTSRCAPPAA